MPFATSSDDTRVYYTQKGDGEPLVLAHGMTHSWDSSDDLGYIDALSDRFRLILFDMRGHGRSEKPHEVTAYSMTQQVDDVVAVVDELAIDRFHFFGYSLGALVGFHLAARAPERVQTLVAYNGHPFAPSAEYRASIERDVEILREGMPVWVSLMEDIGVFRQYPNPEARKERILAADAEALIASILASADEPGVGETLVNVDLPCLLVTGDQSGENDVVRRAARELPMADYVSIAGIGPAMVHTRVVGPYVRAFYERLDVVS